MAYDEGLAQRIRETLQDQADLTERKMFGGLAFMLRGNMLVGVLGDTLMARVGAKQEHPGPGQAPCPAHGFHGQADEGLCACVAGGHRSRQGPGGMDWPLP